MELDDKTFCDCCNEKATEILSKETCEWINSWFIGFYCKKCRDVIVNYTKKYSLKEEDIMLKNMLKSK